MESAFGVDHGDISKSINPKNLGALSNAAKKIRPGDNWTNHLMSSQRGMWAKSKLESRAFGQEAGRRKPVTGGRNTMIYEGKRAAFPGKSVSQDLGHKKFNPQLP